AVHAFADPSIDVVDLVAWPPLHAERCPAGRQRRVAPIEVVPLLFAAPGRTKTQSLVIAVAAGPDLADIHLRRPAFRKRPERRPQSRPCFDRDLHTGFPVAVP